MNSGHSSTWKKRNRSDIPFCLLTWRLDSESVHRTLKNTVLIKPITVLWQMLFKIESSMETWTTCFFQLVLMLWLSVTWLSFSWHVLLLHSISDPFIFNMCSKDRSSNLYSCQRHSYGDLRELRQAQFLLQVFSNNGSRGTPLYSLECDPGNNQCFIWGYRTQLYDYPPLCPCLAFGKHLWIP